MSLNHRYTGWKALKQQPVIVKMEKEKSLTKVKKQSANEVKIKNKKPMVRTDKAASKSKMNPDKLSEDNKAASEEKKISKIKDSLLKETTLKLVLNSNITLFEWYKNKYRCYYCKDLFLDPTLLKQHVKTHAINEFSEKIHQFYNKYYYRAEITDLKCSNCEQCCENLAELSQHLTLVHKVEFETQESLLIPFKLTELICQSCKIEFKSFVTLDHHMTTHYSKTMCETCGKGFRHIQALNSHMNIHLNRRYKCKICNADFESQYKKYKHALAAHNVAYNNICPHCPEKFRNYIARLLHLVEKHGYEKPEHKCTHCQKVYITNALLRSHVRKVHMQERNYECDVCKNKYMRKCELTDHMKSHIQARDFVCSYCSKAFFRRRNLKEHLGIHLESHRHECTVCKKTFAQKYNMKMHKKRCQSQKR